MNSGRDGYMVVPAATDRAAYRAADEASYRAGWRTNASLIVIGGDENSRRIAERLAAKVTAATGHLFGVTECLV